MKNIQNEFLLLCVSVFLFLPVNVNSNKTHFYKCAYMVHIPKSGGMSLSNNFVGLPIGNLGHLPIRVVKQKIVSSESLNKKPILFTWLRDPLKRAISCLRFTKNMALSMKRRGLLPGHGPEMRQYYTKESIEFYTKFADLDLNNINDLKAISEMMKLHPHIFDSPDTWPLLPYEEFFLPPGTENTVMDNDKAELCVEYALENIDFFGILEENNDSLKRFVIATGMQIDTKDSNTHKTPSDYEVIDIYNEDIKRFFKELLKYEYVIHEKLLKAQRWKVAIPYQSTGDEASSGYAITQYTLPQNFDPDQYFIQNASEAQAHIHDIWLQRKWAMLDCISQTEKLPNFIFEEFLDN